MNINYAAQVVRINEIEPIPNMDNVVYAIVGGNRIMVSKETQIGDTGIYFPVECQLSDTFLSKNNLYRDPELNADPTKRGYVDSNGRVRCIKIRGNYSAGVIFPLSYLKYMGNVTLPAQGEFFDTLGGELLCWKYEPIRQRSSNEPKPKKKVKQLRDLMIPGQFSLALDTYKLAHLSFGFQHDDKITITEKIHGCNATFAKVLVKREFNWKERIAKFFGIDVQATRFATVASSRQVIKYVEGEDYGHKTGYYGGTCLWTMWAKRLQPYLPEGITINAEITGYTPSGAAIQKGYPYGSTGTHSKLWIYKITRNCGNFTTEFTYDQMAEFVDDYFYLWPDVNVVPLKYQGTPHDYIHLTTGKAIINSSEWKRDFVAAVEKEELFPPMCPMNNHKVPREGVVVKRDNSYMVSQPYKMKALAFLEHETKLLDDGYTGVEDDEG